MNEIILVPIRIGGSTLLGVPTDKLPVKGGNCFHLIDPNGHNHRVVNFSYENLKGWMKLTGQKDVYVKCIEKSDSIWEIIDERIPKEWYNNDDSKRNT
jgi:hypothetical protein